MGAPRSGDADDMELREETASLGDDAIVNVTEYFGSISGVVGKMPPDMN